MNHLTTEEIIEFVSLEKLDDKAFTLITKVNDHIRECNECRKNVSAFQTVHDEMIHAGLDKDVYASLYGVFAAPVVTDAVDLEELALECGYHGEYEEDASENTDCDDTDDSKNED